MTSVKKSKVRNHPPSHKAFIFIALTLLATPSVSKAQHKLINSNLLLEGRVNYGFLINHHLEMKIFNSHFPAFEINLGKETFGQQRWESEYGYPIIGISYWYSQLGNSEFLGRSNALFPYINYPIVRDVKHELNFRVGLGLGYLTKCFDPVTNYKYLAIGSHVNAAINLMVEYRWRMSPRVQLASGLALMHFSNGSTKTPNYGINSPSINVALAYRLSNENAYQNRKLLPELYKFEFDGKRSVNLNLAATMGYKDMGQEYGKTFMVYNFSGDLLAPLSFKSSGGLGFDFTRNQSDPYFAELQDVMIKHDYELYRMGISLAYQLRMSKLSYMFNTAMYVFGTMAPSFGYFKFGLQYLAYKNVFATLTFRSHLARADFIGLGLGYRLPLYVYKPH
ncbi:MAG TPA: acyloxyacyl hydrolase [Bacteroidales bacterium]|nr:acyloxyacyl hydrolase [Bacteroidales bacterium]HPT02669.1 acyloxyacyl hydrolase [Bacteroidales bacterium]